MRTTVRIDPDLDARLRAITKERGISFREALNGVLRRGLSVENRPEPYQIVSRNLGLRPGVDLTHALRLIAELEDQAIASKLELRK